MGKENILSVGVKSFSTPGNVVPLFRTGPLRTGATWFLQMPTFTNATPSATKPLPYRENALFGTSSQAKPVNNSREITIEWG